MKKRNRSQSSLHDTIGEMGTVYLVNKIWFIGLITTALVTLSASATLLTQIDTFDAGPANWAGLGGPPSGSITNETTGGPAGTGDAYLQLIRGTDPEFHIAIFNTNHWAGNYVAECITALRLDLNHIAGTDPLRIRIMIWGDGGVWGSTSTIPLPATGGGWNTYTFGLTASDLTFVNFDITGPANSGGGSGILADTLSTVNRIQIRHDYDAPPTPPGSHPQHVHGTLGVDNIQAISEPVITSIDVTPGVLDLGISNVNVGATYYVECIEDLTTNNWVEVGSSFEGIKGSTNWMESIGGSVTSAFYRVVRDPYHEKVGEVATLFTRHHGVTGTAHIVNNRTLELRNFYYDGLGPDVYVYVSTNANFYPGTIIGDELNRPSPYVNTNLTFTIPNGLHLDEMEYISIWCDLVGVSFGDGQFSTE